MTRDDLEPSCRSGDLGVRPHCIAWSTTCRTRSSAMSDAVSDVVRGWEEVGERRTDCGEVEGRLDSMKNDSLSTMSDMEVFVFFWGRPRETFSQSALSCRWSRFMRCYQG